MKWPRWMVEIAKSRRWIIEIPISLGVLVALIALSSPVWSLQFEPWRSQAALAEAIDLNQNPLDYHGSQPVIFETTFPKGKATWAYEAIIYSNGLAWFGRDIFDYARQGGTGYLPNATTLKRLAAEPTLPPGLPSEKSVPIGRFLILSQRRSGVYTTRFYDLSNLPPVVQDIRHVLWNAEHGGLTSAIPPP